MNTISKPAFVLYLLAILLMFLGGLVYSFLQQYMPYHAIAVGQPWENLDSPLQVLIIAALNAGGSLTVANALAMAVLLLIPFRRGELWASWAITLVGSLSMVSGLRSAIYVDANTPADPPWFIFIVVILMLILALVASISHHANVSK